MSEVARVSYFENYIDTLKKKDEAKVLDEKRQEKQDNRDRNSATTSINPAISAQNIGNPSLNSPLAPPSMNALNK
jgi:hypothetical protein